MPLSTDGSSDKQAQRASQMWKSSWYQVPASLSGTTKAESSSTRRLQLVAEVRTVDATKELCVVDTDKTLNGTTKFEKLQTALKAGQG